jgi:hypothetical protein
MYNPAHRLSFLPFLLLQLSRRFLVCAIVMMHHCLYRSRDLSLSVKAHLVKGHSSRAIINRKRVKASTAGTQKCALMSSLTCLLYYFTKHLLQRVWSLHTKLAEELSVEPLAAEASLHRPDGADHGMTVLRMLGMGAGTERKGRSRRPFCRALCSNQRFYQTKTTAHARMCRRQALACRI